MLWYKYRTVTHLAQGCQQESTIDDRGQYSYECAGLPFEGKIQQCFEKWRMHLLLLPRSQLCRASDSDIPTWFDS